MIVQWCVKGMHLPGDEHAVALVADDHDVLRNWWRDVATIRPREMAAELTAAKPDPHVCAASTHGRSNRRGPIGTCGGAAPRRWTWPTST